MLGSSAEAGLGLLFMQQVELPAAESTSHFSALDGILDALPQSQLPAKSPEKAGEDGPSYLSPSYPCEQLVWSSKILVCLLFVFSAI